MYLLLAMKGRMLISGYDCRRYEHLIVKIINAETSILEVFPDPKCKLLVAAVIDSMVEMARCRQFEVAELALQRLCRTLRIKVRERIACPDAAQRRYRSTRGLDAY